MDQITVFRANADLDAGDPAASGKEREKVLRIGGDGSGGIFHLGVCRRLWREWRDRLDGGGISSDASALCKEGGRIADQVSVFFFLYWDDQRADQNAFFCFSAFSYYRIAKGRVGNTFTYFASDFISCHSVVAERPDEFEIMDKKTPFEIL